MVEPRHAGDAEDVDAPARARRIPDSAAPGPLRRARWVSSAILPALERSTRGQVLNVFSSAIYLADQNGAVLSLVGLDVGPGPLSIVLDGPGLPLDRLPHAASPVLFEADTIRVDGLVIRWTAPTWPARPPWETFQLGRGPHLEGLRRVLVHHAPRGSLAELAKRARPLADTGLFLPAADVRSDAVLSALSRCIAGASDRHQLGQAASALAGLGGGFTPAGDDFLLGVMYAIWASVPEAQAKDLCQTIAESAAPSTTTVSGAYLRAGAGGAAGAAWHDLAQAWIGRQPAAIDAAARRLMRVGHTSGADVLAGFVLAGEALADAR